ncbi:uncharacterized protein LOC117607112 [Osmia lignaria lignaria]|uniref:uncharacterized protein LOC117607112 n=1 Tax=Osmia lignaria lignaria TaxID=1437193 RepID=UPI00402B55AE
MRTGVQQKRSNNGRLNREEEEDGSRRGGGRGGGGGGDRDNDPNPEDPSTRSAYYQLDWTASRVFVVRPWVVGATTGAGVGLLLLFLVVAVLGNQTCTTTAAPVVSDPYVSLDATPPRLLPRSTDRWSSESTVRSPTSRRFSNYQQPDVHPPPKGELDYHEISLLPAERHGFDAIRLLSPQQPATIDTISKKDTSSSVASQEGGGGGTGRGGRGGGGLAYERTKSRRRQVDDRGSASLSSVQPYWLQGRFSRPRRVQSFSALVGTAEPKRHDILEFALPETNHHDSTSSSNLEDIVRGPASSRSSSTTTTTTTTTTATTTTLATTTRTTEESRITITVPITWTTDRFVHRTVPRLSDEQLSGRRNRKSKDEEVDARDKDGGRFAFAGDGSGEVIGGGGGGGGSGIVDWSTTVAGPMSSWSYPEDEQPGAVRTRLSPDVATEKDEEADGSEEQVKVTVAQGKGSSTSTTGTTTTSSTTQLPPPGQDTSMEALSATSYIVSAVLVLIVGALVGVLATVSHHLHHRRLLLHEPATASILHHHRHHHHRHHHHHHREELPASHQRRLLLQDHHRHPGTPMLSVSPGMEVGSGGGHGGLAAGLEGDPSNGGAGGGVGGERGTDGMQEAMVAAARDRAIRAGSVRQDLALDLPPRLQLPDGEERPYGAHTALHLRDPEQESEIYQKCVRPPPNRTVFDSESPPPYRSQSALLDAPDRIRCHSAGSSLMKVFKKFPSPGSSTPAVVVPPRRPTLSSYSESSSNLSNLSSLTVVPCEADESQHPQQQQHQPQPPLAQQQSQPQQQQPQQSQQNQHHHHV